MWHEYMYNVLNVINNIVLTFIGIPFALQLIYMFLFWLKKKTYKRTDKKNRICVLIPAHNEEDVIYDTVKRIYDLQNYPKESFKVFVVADNCTDKTKELAEKAGATVFVHNDPDPSHHVARYAISYGYEKIKELDEKFDFSIRLDADNWINNDFFSLMNDCYNSGVEMARPYESALNMTQNNYTKACGLYYSFDSRFSSRVRERLGIDAHVMGPGSMISMDIINKNGYDSEGICDDAEFCYRRMLDGYRLHYVEDAVVYEDLPSTFKDTLAKNKRVGAGNVRLIGSWGLKMFFKFFTTFRLSYLEMFLTYLFNIICVILCTWIPAFYIYSVIYLSLAGSGMIETSLLTSGEYMQILITTLIIIAICLSVLFAFAGILQGVLLVCLDYKKLGAKRIRDLISGAFLFPCFTVIYCVTITLGIFSKPKWTKVNRNKSYLEKGK